MPKRQKITKNYATPFRPTSKIHTPNGPMDAKNIPGAKPHLDKLGKKSGDNRFFNIKDYLMTVGTSLMAHKLNDKTFVKLFASSVWTLINHGEQKEALIHENEFLGTTADKGFITKTTCHVGHEPTARIKKGLKGPYSEYKTVILEDTESDRLDHLSRVELQTETGFQQKGVDIFLRDTFITVGDIKRLCKWDELKPEIEGAYEKRRKKIQKAVHSENQGRNCSSLSQKLNYLVESEEWVTNIYNLFQKRILKNDKIENLSITAFKDQILKGKDVGMGDVIRTALNNVSFNRQESSSNLRESTIQNRHACITKTKSVLKIRSRMQLYKTSVIVHLCRFNYPILGQLAEAIGTNLLVEEVKQLKRDQIYNNKHTSQYYLFKEHFDVDLRANLKNYNTFKKHISIIHSWKRELTEGSQFHLSVTEHYKDGINLNSFLEDFKNDEAPIGNFFIVEYFGDRKGNVKRNVDGDVFSGYSPARLDYRLKNEITYIRSNGSDCPLILPFGETDKSFEDETFGESFYPTRKSGINIDANNINLGTNEEDKKASYTLMYNTAILERTALQTLKENLESLGIDETITKNLNEDDIPYHKSFEEESKSDYKESYGNDDGEYENLDSKISSQLLIN